MFKRVRSTMAFWLILVGSGCALVPNVIPSAPGELGRPAVVFDIDGTLTPKPLEFLRVRLNAANAVRLYAEKGYQIIYLSARNNYARSVTLRWLRKHHFPDGITNVAETSADGEHPVQYKTRMLAALLAKGWHVEYAYGDSSSDFTAYASAAIPADHVFGLQREGSRHCQPGPVASCLRGWTEHLAYIALLPSIQDK